MLQAEMDMLKLENNVLKQALKLKLKSPAQKDDPSPSSSWQLSAGTIKARTSPSVTPRELTPTMPSAGHDPCALNN